MTVGRREVSSTTSREALGFTAGLLLVTLVLLASTFSLHPSSALVPRVVGVPLAVLLGYRLIREISSRPTSRDARDDVQPAARSDEIGALLWFVALPALATILGFVAGPAVFVFAWARYRADERPVAAVAAGASTAVVILMLFHWLLKVPLWQGLLGALL